MRLCQLLAVSTLNDSYIYVQNLLLVSFACTVLYRLTRENNAVRNTEQKL